MRSDREWRLVYNGAGRPERQAEAGKGEFEAEIENTGGSVKVSNG